jgi:hypothetical protein
MRALTTYGASDTSTRLTTVEVEALLTELTGA